ncbi:hypothetical protein Tco_0635213 [Tanacetum coccineum]
MTSLKKKYERQRLIPGEIGITSSLHAPKRFPSLSGRKRKAQELEPEVRIPGLVMQDSGLFIVHSRNRLGRLDHGLTEF